MGVTTEPGEYFGEENRLEISDSTKQSICVWWFQNLFWERLCSCFPSGMVGLGLSLMFAHHHHPPLYGLSAMGWACLLPF